MRPKIRTTERIFICIKESVKDRLIATRAAMYLRYLPGEASIGVSKPVPFEDRAANTILRTLAEAHKSRAWPDALALSLLQLFTGRWPAGLARPRQSDGSQDALSRVALPGSTKTVLSVAYTVVGQLLTYPIQASGRARQGSKVHLFCRDLANLRGDAKLAVEAGEFALIANVPGRNRRIGLPGTLNLQDAVRILAESGVVPLPTPTSWDDDCREAALQSGSATVASATDRYKRLVQAGLGVEYLDDQSVPTNAVRTVSIFRTKARDMGLLMGKVDEAYDDLRSLWESPPSDEDGDSMGDDADPSAKTRGGRAPGRPGGFKTFDEFWDTPWVGAMLGRGEPKSLDDERFGDTLDIAAPQDAEADLKDVKRGLLFDTGRLSPAQLLILRAFERYPNMTREQARRILDFPSVKKEFPAALKASRTQPAEAVLAGLHKQIQKDEETFLGAKSIHENIFEKLTRAGVLTEAHRILLTALDWYNKDKASGALKAAAASGVVQNAIRTLRDIHPAIQDDAQAVGHLLMEALKRYEQATGKRLGKPQAFSSSLPAAKHLSFYHFAPPAQGEAILRDVPTRIDGLDTEIELRLATRGLERAAQWGFEGLRQFLDNKEFGYEQAVEQRQPSRAIVDDGPVEISTEDIAWAFATAKRHPRKRGEDLRAWLQRLSELSEDAAG